MPGVPFHITARIQDKAPAFHGIEPLIVERVRAAQARSDARLLAYAVMPNHLHLLVLQGERPLADFMQPLLRRIALLLHQRRGTEGHVFERRFNAEPCLDPEYFRNAVVYIHLNGFRAGLCPDEDGYPWCSHRRYCEVARRAAEPSAEQITIASVLRLFAARDGQSLQDCVCDYRAFLRWRCAIDDCKQAEQEGMSVCYPDQPGTQGGDLHWLRDYSRAALIATPASAPRRMDLRDIARVTVLDEARDMALEDLRSGVRTREIARVRRHFVVRALDAGYKCCVIARFLRVAPTTISTIRSTMKCNGR